jgi:hypothetical protein
LSKAVAEVSVDDSWSEGTTDGEPTKSGLVATMLNALAAQVRCKPAKDMRAAMKADLIEDTHFLESEDHNWEHFPKVLKDLYDEAVGG